MGDVSVGTDERERKLDEIITQYRRAVAIREVTDQREFLVRDPEYAGMLQSLTAPGNRISANSRIFSASHKFQKFRVRFVPK